MYEFLKRIPLFADLPDRDLAQLCENVEDVSLAAGQVLFTEGSSGEQAYVIQSGALEIVKTSTQREILLAVRQAGEVIGEIALLEDTPRMATVRARTDSRLLAIHKEQLEHLLHTSPSAAQAMLHTVLARWRSTEAKLRQREKMAQLGTLTAGVAHELNNPAAAVKRGADQLVATVEQYSTAHAHLNQLTRTAGQEEVLQGLASQVEVQAARPSTLSGLARSDREDELEEWLETHGVSNGWELASTLVDLNLDDTALAMLADHFQRTQLPTIFAWLGAKYTIYNLLAEIGQGAVRISEIVKALKSYAYLDQAPVQSVDIHEGLDNTLLILRSKLGSGIHVHREYDPDLPKIQGYGSELNQVWTNIIDNAADALAGHGNIVLHTYRDGEWVIVEIIDDGPGIPLDIQPRLFDPFFTTKPPGKGTGLGLDISYNIVVNKHKGDVKVLSQPGRTNFQVWLPINFENGGGNPPTLVANVRADDATAGAILTKIHTIAVVGISDRPDRPAHSVPAYLQAHGYRIIPINPSLDEVLGEKSYPDLLAVPIPVDAVEIFRSSEEVPPIVDQAIQIGAKVVWMQEGIINEPAAARARRAGLDVVMDTCMRTMHSRTIANMSG